jgi:hypothetical protein
VLTGDNALSLVGILQCARVAGQGGRLGLFALQHQDLVLDTALVQEDPGPGADAAHTDHLVGDVGQGELIQ